MTTNYPPGDPRLRPGQPPLPGQLPYIAPSPQVPPSVLSPESEREKGTKRYTISPVSKLVKEKDIYGITHTRVVYGYGTTAAPDKFFSTEAEAVAYTESIGGVAQTAAMERKESEAFKAEQAKIQAERKSSFGGVVTPYAIAPVGAKEPGKETVESLRRKAEYVQRGTGQYASESVFKEAAGGVQQFMHVDAKGQIVTPGFRTGEEQLKSMQSFSPPSHEMWKAPPPLTAQSAISQGNFHLFGKGIIPDVGMMPIEINPATGRRWTAPEPIYLERTSLVEPSSLLTYPGMSATRKYVTEPSTKYLDSTIGQYGLGGRFVASIGETLVGIPETFTAGIVGGEILLRQPSLFARSFFPAVTEYGRSLKTQATTEPERFAGSIVGMYLGGKLLEVPGKIKVPSVRVRTPEILKGTEIYELGKGVSQIGKETVAGLKSFGTEIKMGVDARLPEIRLPKEPLFVPRTLQGTEIAELGTGISQLGKEATAGLKSFGKDVYSNIPNVVVPSVLMAGVNIKTRLLDIRPPGERLFIPSSLKGTELYELGRGISQISRETLEGLRSYREDITAGIESRVYGFNIPMRISVPSVRVGMPSVRLRLPSLKMPSESLFIPKTLEGTELYEIGAELKLIGRETVFGVKSTGKYAYRGIKGTIAPAGILIKGKIPRIPKTLDEAFFGDVGGIKGMKVYYHEGGAFIPKPSRIVDLSKELIRREPDYTVPERRILYPEGQYSEIALTSEIIQKKGIDITSVLYKRTREALPETVRRRARVEASPLYRKEFEPKKIPISKGPVGTVTFRRDITKEIKERQAAREKELEKTAKKLGFFTSPSGQIVKQQTVLLQKTKQLLETKQKQVITVDLSKELVVPKQSIKTLLAIPTRQTGKPIFKQVQGQIQKQIEVPRIVQTQDQTLRQVTRPIMSQTQRQLMRQAEVPITLQAQKNVLKQVQTQFQIQKQKQVSRQVEVQKQIELPKLILKSKSITDLYTKKTRGKRGTITFGEGARIATVGQLSKGVFTSQKTSSLKKNPAEAMLRKLRAKMQPRPKQKKSRGKK